MALTELERAALMIEDVVCSRQRIGRKDSAIRALGMSPERHAQMVLALIDRADAEAESPMLVRRLRRLRDARARARRSIADRRTPQESSGVRRTQ